MLSDKKVCFVGAGAMAEAVLAGMLNKRIIKPGAVSVTNRSDRFRLSELVYNFGIVADADTKRKSIREADILILAMKPKDTESALEEIRDLVQESQLFISVIAGISTDFIQLKLKKRVPVIRTMPNTAAAIGQSATGMCRGKWADDKHVQMAVHIFEAVGIVEMVDEPLMDAVTAVSGSGPAYVYYLVESMLSGALKQGIHKPVARELIIQTLLGAANMLVETGEKPEWLREKVTSPNGTTQAAIEALDAFQFKLAIESCIARATARSIELGSQYDFKE